MAIDSSLFGADIPAGTYAAGDVVQLKNIAGPAVVRSGRGAAILKRITVGILGDATAATSHWKIRVKNSDWIDPATSLTTPLTSVVSMDERSGNCQSGCDCPLTPNSSWTVEAECTIGTTTTVANSIFALIDTDYPSVSSITDPDRLQGIPTSLEHTNASTAGNALGTLTSAAWQVFNEDIFKAGYEYALQKMEMTGRNYALAGFVSLANAAGMGGLQRIIPICNVPGTIKNTIEYATKLQKGPMDIKYMMFTNSGTSVTDHATIVMDFVKRRVA